MEWYWIVLITIGIIELITIIIAQFDEDKALVFGCGIIYLIFYIVLYPIRARIKYKRSELYYQKHNITMLQYFLGKRVKMDK